MDSCPFGSAPFEEIQIESCPFGIAPFGEIETDSCPFGVAPLDEIRDGQLSCVCVYHSLKDTCTIVQLPKIFQITCDS